MTINITALAVCFATPTAAMDTLKDSNHYKATEAFKESGLMKAIETIAYRFGADRGKNSGMDSSTDPNHIYTDTATGLAFDCLRQNHNGGDQFVETLQISKNGQTIVHFSHSECDPSFSEDDEAFHASLNKIDMPALLQNLPDIQKIADKANGMVYTGPRLTTALTQ